MSMLTETSLYERWRKRWEGFLRLAEAADSPEEARNVLRDKVTIGNAERKIAGGHEGREILELLQNARDAIWRADAEQGRVHVGVYDEGVLVANTGSRFDLFDPEVEDAVTMIGETGKGDEDDQSIGHKGVGLKSILATGDAFEIYTRPEVDSDEILGVRLSRAYLVASLLKRLGQDNGVSGLTDELADAELKRLLSDGDRTEAVQLTDELSDSISKLPLFNFPVPLSTNQVASDPVQIRVQELLTDQPSNPDKQRFRTAVFIRYEDTDWRSQLSSLGVDVPEEEEGSIENRPERIWEYLSAGEGEGGLQPETIIQLGGIEELCLERAPSAGDESTIEEKWHIRRHPNSGTVVSELAHDDIRVQIRAEDETIADHRFDQFRFAESREHHTTILVNKAAGDDPVPVRSYPLYLFYPIESTDTVQLPFCFHGRFRVETNRKALSPNNEETNQRVLEEGIDLVELIGREVAADAPETPNYSDLLPWALLPPVPDEGSIDDPSSDELLDWFQQQVLDRLAATECVPTREGPKQPSETLLHWNDAVIGGYQAFRAILNDLDRDHESIAGPPLPARQALDAILTLPDEWSVRLKRLLHAGDGNSISQDILTGWVDHLDASLSMQEDQPPAVPVAADASRSLLQGTVSLLTAASDSDGTLQDTLADLAERFDGVYLLPCRIRGVDPDEQLALVTLEQRRTPSGGQRPRHRVRSVIWDIESASREVERPPTPPQSSNMTVYFLDEHVQQRSDVHHVLSTAGRVWGLRAYEGMPSFVRSLLDTFADGRQDVVEPIDFAFLAAIVDRLGAESSDLQTDEGSFFPLEYLRSAVPQQEGDQRSNLRRRVQLRTCQLHLHRDEPRPIGSTVFGDEWQRIREPVRTEDEENDDELQWKEIASDAYPAPTWPAPDSVTWEVFQEQIHREVTPREFAQTLGLLGVATLPGIQVLWMYGDEHPPMRQDHHWDPTKWSSKDFSGSVPDTVRTLQSLLAASPDYLDLITSPDYHPQQSADHSQKCSVKVSGDLDQVNLASWIWVDDKDALVEHGDAVRELLRRHGEKLDSSLLLTGWSCNNGHKRRAWTDAIPSLLNWQLRELDIWGPVVAINDELETEWGEQATRLRYAVRLESRRGAQAARMFPHVEEDSGFSDGVLDTLGVRPVGDLGMTGSTERLQKLQSVLVDGTLPAEGTMQLWIPGERINDWNQAYTQLLQPVLKRLPEGGDGQDADLEWGALTHLPLRDGDQWVSAPIDWITENAEQIKYYKDQSPKPWETQAVEDEDYYILPRTAGGPFTRLAGALGVEQLEASKLVFDLDDEDLTLVTEDYEQEVGAFQRGLAERRDLLVSSTERTDDEEILATADSLSKAASNITIAEAFPDDALRQLSDPTSALYSTEEGHEALILNASAASDGLSLDGLAMGIALLVERPTKVATFREALRDDVSVTELETRWAKRTFPIETIKRVLGSNALQTIERDFAALNDLLDQLDLTRADTDLLVEAVEDASNESIVIVREWMATANRPEAFAGNADEQLDIFSIESIVNAVWTELPADLDFVASAMFGDTVTHWVRELERHDIDPETERILISWLDEHREILERPPFNNSAREAYTRLLTIEKLWEQTASTELTDIETWVARLRELQTSVTISWTASLPEEHSALFDCPPFVVHVCINERIVALVEEFCDGIEPELSDVDFNWRALVNTYVEEGTIPALDHETGAKDHQERAFSELATVITAGDDEGGLEFSTDFVKRATESERVKPSLSVSTGGSGGGGSTQFKGRGQQAEAYVMAGVLDRVANWLEHSPSDMIQFRSRLRRLHSNQQETNYTWHVENVWSSELLPLLERPDEMEKTSITDWRTELAAGTPFTGLPLIQFINVTMERGPGFDVIDPCGPISTDEGVDDLGLEFTPVEVKAVDGSTSPFSFRLTTNEYRQAKAFIRDGNIPYVIRLVKVPESGTHHWPRETEIVIEKVLETESELNEIVGSRHFEDIVKGGYMNMKID